MYYIGVDLGGTSIKAGLVDESYNIIATKSLPTRRERSAEEIIKDMASLCKALIEEKGITEQDVSSIGIGCPGLASAKDGIILSSSNLNFENINVKEIMAKYIQLPVYVENDANCAAIGETVKGAAKGESEVVVLTFGTGIGGGLILNGNIYRGGFFGAGEVGHQVVRTELESACGCGRKGCWEQYASASALVRNAKKVVESHPESLLIKNAPDQRIDNINGKIIFEAAIAGDQVAIDVLDHYFDDMAVGIANMINILEPQMIVIGGGISAQKEYILKHLEPKIQKQMYGGLAMKTKISIAELGNDAGIIGAAYLEKTVG